jgi:hypothetical protein
MKKFFLVSLLLSLAIAYGYSQTYYYQAVASIDANGAKSKASGGQYITFLNGKRSCYESDKDGYKVSGSLTGGRRNNFDFIKTKDGTHVYESKPYIMPAMYGAMGSLISPAMQTEANAFIYFSSDFSQMIYERKPFTPPYGTTIFGYKTEYKRTNGPQDVYDNNIPTF